MHQEEMKKENQGEKPKYQEREDQKLAEEIHQIEERKDIELQVDQNVE